MTPEPRDLSDSELWQKSILRSQARRRALEQARAQRTSARRAGTVAIAAAAALPAATGVATAGSAAQSTSSQPAVSAAPQSLLMTGSRGAWVVDVQRALGVPADGVYGPQTAAAVRSYQEVHGLLVDSIVGPQTWGSLGLGSWGSATAAGTSTSAGHTGVAGLQRALGIPADGVFGRQTAAAVRHYQRAHG